MADRHFDGVALAFALVFAAAAIGGLVWDAAWFDVGGGQIVGLAAVVLGISLISTSLWRARAEGTEVDAG